MAQRGKAISVKVSRLKVIKALQDALAKLEAQFKQDEKAQKAYERLGERIKQALK